MSGDKRLYKLFRTKLLFTRLTDGGRMLWLLLALIPLVGCSRVLSRDASYLERQDHDAVAMTMRPHIDYCRSPNMEDFTCWWHPLDNMSDDQEVTYVLTYSKDKGPKHDCPDYVSGGPHSCHFDSSHTSIWKIYCMNVTAITAHRNFTSQEHCLDVAEIVQTEAPVNLTYVLADAGGDEMGHNAQLSWTYPVPSDLQFGWITLVYELQYRRVTEPDKWKVKQSLRESHVELLGLPVGDYVVRVRCRSHNYGLWSKWSATLLMTIPARTPAGKLLVLILVTGVGVVALLVIGFGIIPQSKRIKSYFLPPIPKPRIIGIDPLLLKKGHMDEINRHFSTFHSYSPPRYSEEVWDQVSTDDSCLTLPRDCGVPSDPPDTERDALMVPRDPTPMATTHHQFAAQNLAAAYVQTPAPYSSLPPEAFAPTVRDVPSPWAWPGIVPLPGTDYSVMGQPGQPDAAPAPKPAAFTATRPPQDFYTCVQLMNESGEVHLVPCLAPAFSQESPSSQVRVEPDEGEKEEKKRQLADYQARKNALAGRDGSEAERSEVTGPLLPVAVDNRG